jgi:hypothetical protein
MPARAISDRAVRRKSCSFQPLTPAARSSAALNFEIPPIGTARPRPANT